jgi:hypothetical protein
MTLKTIYDHERNCFVLASDAPKANAFDWKNWECPVTGKINWRPQNIATKNSASMTNFVENKRKTSPTHGTVYGMTDKDSTVEASKRMKKPRPILTKAEQNKTMLEVHNELVDIKAKKVNETKELSSEVLARKPKAKRGEAQRQA